MTISQFEAEPAREETRSYSEDTLLRSTSPQNKRNPPARNTSRFWFERFLAIIQRQNPSVIDTAFVGQIAPSNEGKLMAQLKFLGVIDEQGKPSKLLPMLNMVGEEQKKAFREIADSAYKDLQGEVKMDKAVPDDLVNFFIRKYVFTRDKAINAAKFYLYLAEKGAIPVSADLGSFLTEKASNSVPSNVTSSSVTAKFSERATMRSQVKEGRAIASVPPGRQNHGRKSRSVEFQEKSPVQAVINIRLEKDTPKEYWDRVLALLGERQPQEEPKELPVTALAEENLDQELSSDSAFT
jgi:hypothetical protein